MAIKLFIGGVSGVGKTTLLNSIRHIEPQFHHMVAGELIRRGLSRSKTDSSHTSPRVEDPNEADFFQEMLISEFQRESQQGECPPIVLDGHFIIPTTGGPSLANSLIFSRLGFDHLYLLLGEPRELAVRLSARTPTPPWWDGTVDSLADFQDLETSHAIAVAIETGIQLSASNDPEELKKMILQGLRNQAP